MQHGIPHPTDPRWWCHGLSQEGLEARFLRGHGLVLIDRSPCIRCEAGEWLSQRIKGPGGTYATPVEEPRYHHMEGLRANETLLHSVHGGLDGGSAVLLDQYLLMQDEEPVLLIRLITPVNGQNAMAEAEHDDLLMHLLRRSAPDDGADGSLQ